MWLAERRCLCSRENHIFTSRKYLKHPGAGFVIAVSEAKEVLHTRESCVRCLFKVCSPI